MIQLSYSDVTDLAELVSHMESASLPTGHTASLTVRDPVGRHYATIDLRPNGEAVLMIAEIGDGDRARADIQDTPPGR